jgi:formyl-CoA transferase
LRSQNRDALNAILEERTRTRTSGEWIASLNEAGVPCGPIYAIDEVFADPQVEHLEIARPIDHPELGDIEVVGQAVELSRAPDRPYRPTPERGADTDDILRGLGLDADAIADLRARQVI